MNLQVYQVIQLLNSEPRLLKQVQRSRSHAHFMEMVLEIAEQHNLTMEDWDWAEPDTQPCAPLNADVHHSRSETHPMK